MGVNGIYGLSGSGLDIESMVKVGMMSRQNEYDKMAQKYTQNEWKKSAYLELNSQITTFNMSALTDYKLQSTMNAKTAESSDESAVKVTANSDAAIMSHRVDVLRLSSNAHLISGKSISDIIGDNKYDDYNADSNKNKTYLKHLFLDDSFKYDKDAGTVTRENKGYSKSEETKYTFADNTKISTDTSSKISTVTLADGGKVEVNSSESNKTVYTYTKDGVSQTMTLTAEGGFTTINFSSDDPNKAPSTKLVLGTDSSGAVTFDFTDDGFPKITLKGNTATLQMSSSDSQIALTTASNGAISSVKVGSTGYTTASGYASKEETFTNGNENPKIILTTYADGKADVQIGNDEKYTSGTVTTATADGITSKTISFADGSSILLNDATNPTSFSVTNSQDQNAISFKIGDGAKETSIISYTYKDILDGNKSITDLVSKINSEAGGAGLSIKAAYDTYSGKFSLYNSKAGGENDSIIVTAVSDKNASGSITTHAGTAALDFFDKLGLVTSKDGVLGTTPAFDFKEVTVGAANKIAEGSAGEVKIDGVTYNNIEDNKLVNVNGLTYNFLKTTGTTSGTGNNQVTSNPVTVSVSQNTDGIIDKVKSFVESYNKILSGLYEKYDEKADSNYKPLTQSQKDSMTEEQIKKWEDKAKEGLLYHDSTLSKIISQMRESISAEVKGATSTYTDSEGNIKTYTLSAYSIGISTTGLKGQLKLDEDKLKSVLANDPDAVYKVFGKLDNDAKVSNKYGFTEENGVAQRLGEVLNNATKLIKTRAGSSSDVAEDSDLNNLLRELQTKMSNFKKLMSAFEDRLYKKYDAMESALSQLGMQLNFITGAQS